MAHRRHERRPNTCRPFSFWRASPSPIKPPPTAATCTWRGQHEVTFEAVRAQRDARRRRCHVPTELGSRGDTSHPPSVDDPWLGLKPVLPPEASPAPVGGWRCDLGPSEAATLDWAQSVSTRAISGLLSTEERKSARRAANEPWHGWSGMDLQETHMETQADAPTQSNDLPMDHDQHQASMDVQ